MHTPTVSETSRATAHRRQVELVRASLLRGVGTKAQKSSRSR